MSTQYVRLPLAAIVLWTLGACTGLFGAVVPVTDAGVLSGLSPYNWVCKEDSISSSVCGASLAVGFKGTRQVTLQVDTAGITTPVPARYPIIAWTVNGGPLQTQQLAPQETSVLLASAVPDPVIDLYIKGMSPFEDRWSGDIPPNAVKITGFTVDEGGSATAVPLPEKVWLNIGDSIMSGDGAAYAEGQGRPPSDLWAAADDGRASYGYLLAQHYGYREARMAYGGYNWRGGLAKIPALSTLIEQRTATVSRLSGEALSPVPAVVLINLGENGRPAEEHVITALQKLRSRVGKATRVIVMVPLSGQGRAEVTGAFHRYQTAAKDDHAHLIDLGRIPFATADRQHPTAAGHRDVFKAALSAFDAVLVAEQARSASGQPLPQPADQLATTATRELSWRQTETSVALLNHGKMVWEHVHDKQIGKPFMRFGLLDGTELTRPWPYPKGYPRDDHPWHRALWWSWKAINGVNYWEGNQTGTEPVKVTVATKPAGWAQIESAIAYHRPNESPVAWEQRRVTVSEPDAAGTYFIDWEASFSAPGQNDVRFDQNSYGGFALRMAAECCGDADRKIPAWTLGSSEGRADINSRAARWVSYQGTAPHGQAACVAVFDHPDNPRHPALWQTRSQYPYLNPSLTCQEDYVLRPGDTLRLSTCPRSIP